MTEEERTTGLTAADVYRMHLQAMGIRAVRQLKRYIACFLAGDVGEEAYQGLLIFAPFTMRASVHELFHAVSKYLFGSPEQAARGSAIAIWEDGGLTDGTSDPVGNLEEAKEAYKTGKSDWEELTPYREAFQAAGLQDPVPHLRLALRRLFLQERYRRLLFKFGKVIEEEGYVPPKRTVQFIEAELGPRKDIARAKA